MQKYDMMKRRNFLKGSALAGSGMLLANSFVKGESLSKLPVEETDSLYPTRLSIMCYSFFRLKRTGVMDIFGFFESCKYRYDVQACDLWDGFLDSREEDYLKKIKFALDDRDLVCSSIAWDAAAIWKDDAAARENAYMAALEAFNVSKILGTKFLRIDAGGGFRDTDWTDEAFDYIVEKYKEYCKMAQDNGFRVGPEVHYGPETSLNNMKRLFEAVDHPAMGLILHFGNFKGNDEEQLAADKEVAKWACATHIAWPICLEENGFLKERMGFLRDTGYKGYYGVEHHSMANEYANVGIQLAAVRGVIEDWRNETQPQGMPGF